MLDDKEHQGEASLARKGGEARARALTPERRKEIAQNAAEARWGQGLQQAVCGSPDRLLHIGNSSLEAYVLEDGTRVLTQAEFQEALGRHRKANVHDSGTRNWPSAFPAIRPSGSLAFRLSRLPAFRLSGFLVFWFSGSPAFDLLTF